jgi:hypothetical protein
MTVIIRVGHKDFLTTFVSINNKAVLCEPQHGSTNDPITQQGTGSKPANSTPAAKTAGVNQL